MTATTIIPTESAIDTAFKNAQKAIGYQVIQSKSIPHRYTVVKPGFNGKISYSVSVLPGFESCQCEQFKAVGVCKHQVLVADHIRYEEMAELDAAREEEERAAFFAASTTIQGQIETVPAGAPGACDVCGSFPLFDDEDDAANVMPFCHNCESNALGATNRRFI